ncbi:MAG: Zn-ribbon domain-containing OB-fold protein [Deltaproteobacteria bacterium]|nr:Zn-ribbon domain-containing OB-fold protein [Deltaproteobacteria bacterium]
MRTATKPIPTPDPDSWPFWRAARQHQLLLQRCPNCGHCRYPPKAFCNHCHTLGGEWRALRGRGRLVSWTVQHHLLTPAFADELPYVVLLVALEERPNVRLVGNLRGGTVDDLKIGRPGQAVFEDITDEIALIHWQPV